MRLAPLRLAASIIALAAACAAPPSSEHGSAANDPIVGGTASDASQNFVVLIYDAVDGFECSGSLIAPSLVLTARHCVSEISGDSLACDEKGNAASGGQIGADYPPGRLAIYVGDTRPGAFPSPAVHARAIVHDGATNLCSHDLAILELDTPIASTPTAVLRLDARPTTEDKVTVVGWGASNATDFPKTRLQRTGVAVESVGPTVWQGIAIAPNAFIVGESICDGDSGSPAIAESTGAILGVASYGSNGMQPVSNHRAVACVSGGMGVVNTFTSLTPFRSVVERAFADTGAQPKVDDVTPAAPPAPTPPRHATNPSCALRVAPAAVPCRARAGAWLGGVLLLFLLRRARRSRRSSVLDERRW